VIKGQGNPGRHASKPQLYIKQIEEWKLDRRIRKERKREARKFKTAVGRFVFERTHFVVNRCLRLMIGRREVQVVRIILRERRSQMRAEDYWICDVVAPYRR
jgi:hypothetical protein